MRTLEGKVVAKEIKVGMHSNLKKQKFLEIGR